MGSCISKCKSKRKKPQTEEEEERELATTDVVTFSKIPVQDELVIANSHNRPPLPPRSPLPSLTTTRSSFLSSLSPSASTSTEYSHSSTTTNSSCSSSLSSASSSASSISISHNPERLSFSNEFLLSCAKDSPHIVPLDPTKLPKLHHALPRSTQHAHNGGARAAHKLLNQQAAAAGVPQKRPRAGSPNLTRQKSFRRKSIGPDHLGPSTKPSSLRSPSPSRRFSGTGGGDNGGNWNGWRSEGERGTSRRQEKQYCLVNAAYNNRNTRRVHSGTGGFLHGSKMGNSSVGRGRKLDKLGNSSDVNNCSTRRLNRSPSLRKKSEQISRVGSRRVDDKVGIAAGDQRLSMGGAEDVEMIPVEEDFDNPLIALDCFIFL